MNTCPVGVATQDPELRKRFTGNPDHVVNFFQFMVQELREIMADLGFRTVNEMVGQVENLEMRENITHWKYSKLDLSPILYKEPTSLYTGLHKMEEQDHGLEDVLDWKLLKTAQPAIDKLERVAASFPIRNTDRTAGTILSNEITKQKGCRRIPFISISPELPDKALVHLIRKE
jgi:glutamate synthase (NADPH) large chain